MCRLTPVPTRGPRPRPRASLVRVRCVVLLPRIQTNGVCVRQDQPPTKLTRTLTLFSSWSIASRSVRLLEQVLVAPQGACATNEHCHCREKKASSPPPRVAAPRPTPGDAPHRRAYAPHRERRQRRCRDYAPAAGSAGGGSPSAAAGGTTAAATSTTPPSGRFSLAAFFLPRGLRSTNESRMTDMRSVNMDARMSSISERTSCLGVPSDASSAPPSISADSSGPVSRAVAEEAASLRRCCSLTARTKMGMSVAVGYWRRSARTALVHERSSSSVTTTDVS
mmetsp:Transcript_10516/g.31418  ORF Transcript_10516/g.31418 Transcript_10516/m.31418 type:complete len:280 (+) Transcript_10516:2-841(+)